MGTPSCQIYQPTAEQQFKALILTNNFDSLPRKDQMLANAEKKFYHPDWILHITDERDICKIQFLEGALIDGKYFLYGGDFRWSQDGVKGFSLNYGCEFSDVTYPNVKFCKFMVYLTMIHGRRVSIVAAWDKDIRDFAMVSVGDSQPLPIDP